MEPQSHPRAQVRGWGVEPEAMLLAHDSWRDQEARPAPALMGPAAALPRWEAGACTVPRRVTAGAAAAASDGPILTRVVAPRAPGPGALSRGRKVTRSALALYTAALPEPGDHTPHLRGHASVAVLAAVSEVQWKLVCADARGGGCKLHAYLPTYVVAARAAGALCGCGARRLLLRAAAGSGVFAAGLEEEACPRPGCDARLGLQLRRPRPDAAPPRGGSGGGRGRGGGRPAAPGGASGGGGSGGSRRGGRGGAARGRGRSRGGSSS
jgi:hypothetical protein